MSTQDLISSSGDNGYIPPTPPPLPPVRPAAGRVAARPKAPQRGSRMSQARQVAIDQLAVLALRAPKAQRHESAAGALLAWLISFTFNLGILAVVLCFLYLVVPKREPDQPIIIPNGFEDPAFSEHPGGIPHPGAGSDPARDAAQNLREMARSEGWAQSDAPQNLAGLLGGAAGDTEAAGIFAGAGGSMGATGGNDSGGGKVAAYGTPGGGAGSGPKSSFYGTGGNATRIVYILDRSGSMLDNYEFLKKETQMSINNLVPLQFVGVVMFAETAEPLPPGNLVRATPDAKRALLANLEKYPAQGRNDEDLAPFQMAFQRAFAMKPELIYFLTDGKFDPELIKVVNKLNADKKVSINTLAFVTEEPSYKDLLQQLARDNHGVYKFIAEKDLR